MNAKSLKQKLKELLEFQDNNNCVDCGASHPLWACILNGVFMCSDCSIIHKEMDSSITFVKLVTLADFTDNDIKLIKCGGNRRFLQNLNEFGLIDIYNPYSLKSRMIKEKYLYVASSYYREILRYESDQGCQPNAPSYEDGRNRLMFKEEETQINQKDSLDKQHATEKEENKLIGRIKNVPITSSSKSKSVIQSTTEKITNSQIAQSIKSNGSGAINKIGGAGDYLSDKACSLAVSLIIK